jgi:phosphoribosylaminoimidazole-succinocarboxamide synthase
VAGTPGAAAPPVLDPSIWEATTARYIDTFERLTGESFVRGEYPVAPRITTALKGISE